MKSITTKIPTLKAANGNLYVPTGNGKVKKLKKQKAPISISELSDMVEEVDTQMSEHLLVIYKALKGKDPDATFKKGVIDCRMFRISFDENGFFIRDLKDFNKKCDFTYEDIFPTPREIWEYITRPRIKNSSEDEDIKRSKKILKYRKEVELIKPEPKKEETQKQVVEITEAYLNAQRKKALATITRTKDYKNLIKKLPELLPHRGFKILFGKIVRDLKNKKIRPDKFKRLTKELVETVSFAEKLKPAPKFIGLPFWKISELTITDENKVNMLMSNGKDKYAVFKCEFLARYMLSIEPGVMPQLMRYLRGEITKEAFLGARIVKNRFVHFDNKLLHKDVFNSELFEVCEEILYFWGEPNPLKVVYRNQIKESVEKADKVKVYFEDSYTYYNGIIVAVDEGILIRYEEDGDISPLMQHQRWFKR